MMITLAEFPQTASKPTTVSYGLKRMASTAASWDSRPKGLKAGQPVMIRLIKYLHCYGRRYLNREIYMLIRNGESRKIRLPAMPSMLIMTDRWMTEPRWVLFMNWKALHRQPI